MKKLKALLFLMLLASTAGAQQSLELIDVLPPYELSATLLANGHFSIRTGYASNTTRQLIYREDGSSGLPVNYTSHVHFKVDDIVFQLPFEEDTLTRTPPPQHPLNIERLFADTVAGNPRINADMYGIMPDGDTMRFIFTMEPSLRPSGGFIKLSARVNNRSKKVRNVGALFFFDTQIGSNDRAPITTAFGYSDVETDFTKGAGLGMPEFWLALEGSPVDPQLTARGNLRASGLIEPDYFIFGNWTDFNTTPVIKGLASVLWNERGASLRKYTDSGVLMRWEQVLVQRGEIKLLAATEIGIVDSLEVFAGTGGNTGEPLGSGIFVAGPGGCFDVATNDEVPCGRPGYSPYSPDSVQLLYLITNQNPQQLRNVQLIVDPISGGLSARTSTAAVIPAALDSGATGVGIVSFYAAPRLHDTTFRVPIKLTTSSGSAAVYDTVCINVPGLLPSITLEDAQFPPLCPGTLDTLDVILHVEGVRCLPISLIELLSHTNPGDLSQFQLVQPVPSEIPADGIINVRVKYSPNVLDTQRVKIALHVRSFESFAIGDTTFEFTRDTAIITGVGKDAEFFLADTDDTLNFGKICVGDTSEQEWPVLNKGGCEVMIDRAVVVGGVPGQFSITNNVQFPMRIDRAAKGGIGKALVEFTPKQPGLDRALLILSSLARPKDDTLMLVGLGDVPTYELDTNLINFDTVCPGKAYTLPLTLLNPSVCPADIDSISISGVDGFTVQPQGRFTISGSSSVSPQIGVNFLTTGLFTTTGTIHSKLLGNKNFTLSAVAALRILKAGGTTDFGDILVGARGRKTVTVTSTGTAGVTIQDIRLLGSQSAEFSFVAKPAMPYFLPAGGTLSFDIDLAPTDLEDRRASLVFDLAGEVCVATEPVTLKGRGIQPLIDVPRKLVDGGRVCIGESLDTTITIRNFGNAPLAISNLRTTGSTDIKVSELGPITVDSNATKQVGISFSPSSIGDQELKIEFLSNGKWLTAPDTIVTFKGTGILCGTLSVDTVRGTVGEMADVPVRFTPTNPSVRAAVLMDQANHEDANFTISHNARIFRFNSNVSGGMLQGAGTTVRPDRITVTTGNGASLQDDNIVAMLGGEVLLGDDFQTPLVLNVTDFADGFAKLDVRHGQLIANYCALDRRYVTTTKGSYIIPRQSPLSKEGQLLLYLAEDASVNVALFDLMGRSIGTLVNGARDQGSYELSLSDLNQGVSRLSQGAYLLRLITDGEVRSQVILVE